MLLSYHHVRNYNIDPRVNSLKRIDADDDGITVIVGILIETVTSG
jgi:hypothetical protein